MKGLYLFFQLFSIVAVAVLVVFGIILLGQIRDFQNDINRDIRKFEEERNKSFQDFRSEIGGLGGRVYDIEEDLEEAGIGVEQPEYLYPIEIPAGEDYDFIISPPPIQQNVSQETIKPEAKERFDCPWGGILEEIPGGNYIAPCWYPN